MLRGLDADTCPCFPFLWCFPDMSAQPDRWLADAEAPSCRVKIATANRALFFVFTSHCGWSQKKRRKNLTTLFAWTDAYFCPKLFWLNDTSLFSCGVSEFVLSRVWRAPFEEMHCVPCVHFWVYSCGCARNNSTPSPHCSCCQRMSSSTALPVCLPSPLWWDGRTSLHLGEKKNRWKPRELFW